MNSLRIGHSVKYVMEMTPEETRDGLLRLIRKYENQLDGMGLTRGSKVSIFNKYAGKPLSEYRSLLDTHLGNTIPLKLEILECFMYDKDDKKFKKYISDCKKNLLKSRSIRAF